MSTYMDENPTPNKKLKTVDDRAAAKRKLLVPGLCWIVCEKTLRWRGKRYGRRR